MADESVLIIDDDIELCELITQYLEEEGFSVRSVHHGPAGIERAMTDDYDVIILDVMMPGMNGFEVLRQLRANEVETPVLMLTARGDDVDRIVGLEIGADDYISKPCNPRVLVARIRALLRRVLSANIVHASEPIVVDDVTLNPALRQVELAGKELNLTNSEYCLLLALLSSPGEAIGKRELMRNALGKSISPFDRTLDMHISNLRAKLGPLSDGRSRIKTVRGFGYVYQRLDA